MPEYTADEIAKIEFTEDEGVTNIPVNLFKQDAISVTVTPVKSVVNKRQNATSKKQVVISFRLHDLDAATKAALETIEANFTECAWVCTLLDSAKSFTTLPALINVTEEFNNAGDLLGYLVESQYDIDRSQSWNSDETVTGAGV